MNSTFKISKKIQGNKTSREINTGSMADIAFLLLIFFLVATTILNDSGILVKLPAYQPNENVSAPVKERNIYTVKINAQNQLLAEGQQIDLKYLKDEIKQFIVNPLGNVNLSEQPDKAVVSLQNDRGTKYEVYIQVYNEIKTAYNELWEEIATSRHGKPMLHLTTSQIDAIKKDFPLVISEAEPRRFGVE